MRGGFGFHFGIYRDQVILPVHFNSVARVKHHRQIGIQRLFRKLAQGDAKALTVKIFVQTDIKAHCRQLGRNRAGVVHRIGQRGIVLVGRIANHQGDTGFGAKLHAKQKQHRDCSANFAQPPKDFSRHVSRQGQ